MTDNVHVRLVWHLSEDGKGTANVMADQRSSLDQHRYVFDSLDELPPEIGEVIRKDGRQTGEVSITAN